MHWTRVSIVAAVLACALFGAIGCTTDEPVEEPPSASTVDEADEQAIEQSAEESGIAEWFEGAWMVDFALTSVSPDADWSRMAAAQPSASWKCQVNGSEMILDAGLHVYTGTLVADGDTWSYDAMATYLDEEGVEWTSHIVFDGIRESDEAFSAEQWGEIASDTEGTLYVATWDAIGTRIE
ncbi:MAG: hypothetical protein RBS17_07770 [Coriobacteriia bacterium]|nr:hypothetical protein [Coriobacteriia bacterium]